jgi:hypothetical protein
MFAEGLDRRVAVGDFHQYRAGNGTGRSLAGMTHKVNPAPEIYIQYERSSGALG